MKILFLCKRRPQGRDLFTRPYGRFFYLPRLLASKGHEVYLLLLSYRNEKPIHTEKYGITWISESLRLSAPFSYYRCACKLVRNTQPDYVVGFSDTYFGILAEHLGRRFGIRSVVDAYDNYESYIPWLSPLHRLWRKALKGASAVTAAGPQLSEFLQQSRPGRPVHIVPMAVDPNGFEPMDQECCRRRFCLPLRTPLVGYCGSIYHNRGIQVLFDAFDYLHRKCCNVQLIISGRKERSVRLPSYVKWMGYLPDEDIPYLLNAMNVLVVINQVSSFGHYSYPTKLYEAMACGIPVVATATEPVKWILYHRHQFLAAPEDPLDMAEKIWTLLPAERANYGHLNSWENSCRLFENALLFQS